jgi:hypothetical protein
MSPPVFSFGGLNAFALENYGLESVSGRIIRWVARKSRLAGKDDWTARTPQPEQVHRNCCKIPISLIIGSMSANAWLQTPGYASYHNFGIKSTILDQRFIALPVDWNVVASLQHSRDGQNLKALAIFQRAMQEAESDSDRAAIVLGEASCYSQLGNIVRSRELLESAKTFAGADRALLSQVELSEASLDAQEKKYGIACEKFAALKSKYHDLLVQPENDDFALELDSRLACAFVDAGKCSEAIPIFRKIFERGELEDKQRLQVYFGAALLRVGHSAEAQPILFEAARGANTELSQTALQYLSAQNSGKMR